jgi:hypothetical protein
MAMLARTIGRQTRTFGDLESNLEEFARILTPPNYQAT